MFSRKIADIPEVMSGVVKQVEDETNMRVFTMIAGPMPEKDGKVAFMG